MSHHDSCPSLLGFSLQLLNNPLPTCLTLFCSPNSSDTSNLHSHPSLSRSSFLKGHQSIYSLAWFPCLESSPCWSWHSLVSQPQFPLSIPSPGAYNNLLPQQLPMDPLHQITFVFKLGGFFQMLCMCWMRQEGHQVHLRHNLTGCAF